MSRHGSRSFLLPIAERMVCTFPAAAPMLSMMELYWYGLSLTAGKIRPGVEVESAGLNHDADVPLTPEQIQWAEIIFVMEHAHRSRLARRFRQFLRGKRVVVLNIPDDFDYMDPELIALIKRRCAAYLP